MFSYEYKHLMDTFSLLSQGLYLPQLEEKFQDHSEIIISLHLNLTLKTEMVQVWNHAETDVRLD